MRIGSLLVALVLVVGALWLLGIVDFTVNDAGEMPRVSVEGGRVPDVDVTVNRPDVEITTEERTVEVPKVEVE